MQVSSVLDSPSVASSSTGQTSEKKSSFAALFLNASSGSSSTTSSSGSTSAADSVDDAVKEFMDYAKETPEQRLFNNWLGTQGISAQDYKAMSPEQQHALQNKFEEQMKEKLKDNSAGSLNVAIATTLSAPASQTATASGSSATKPTA